MRSDLNLADAILIGSSAVRAKAGVQYQSPTEGETPVGCALGMANIAAGATYSMGTRELAPRDNARSRDTAMVWGEWVRKVVPRPCECREKSDDEMVEEVRATRDRGDWPPNFADDFSIFKLLPLFLPIQDVITHLFDQHVMADPATWTLEQLADWVREVEGPAREEEEKKRQKRMSAYRYSMFDSYWPVKYVMPSPMMPSWMHAAMLEALEPVKPIDFESLLGPERLSTPQERQGYTWNSACAAWVKVTPAPEEVQMSEPTWPGGAMASNGRGQLSNSEPITLDTLLKMANMFKEVAP